MEFHCFRFVSRTGTQLKTLLSSLLAVCPVRGATGGFAMYTLPRVTCSSLSHVSAQPLSHVWLRGPMDCSPPGNSACGISQDFQNFPEKV